MHARPPPRKVILVWFRNLMESRKVLYSQIRINTRNPRSSDRVWQWLEPPLRLPLRGIGSPDLRVVVAAHDTDHKFSPFWDGDLWYFSSVQTLDRSSDRKNSTLQGTVVEHEGIITMWQEINKKWKLTLVWLLVEEGICKLYFSKRVLGRWWRLTNAKSLCKLRRDKEACPTGRTWGHYHPVLPLGFQDEADFVHPDVGQGPKILALTQKKSNPLQRMLKYFIRNSVICVRTEGDSTHDIWAISSSSDNRFSLSACILARTEGPTSQKTRRSRMLKLTQDTHDILSVGNLPFQCIITSCQGLLLGFENFHRWIVDCVHHLNEVL